MKHAHKSQIQAQTLPYLVPKALIPIVEKISIRYQQALEQGQQDSYLEVLYELLEYGDFDTEEDVPQSQPEIQQEQITTQAQLTPSQQQAFTALVNFIKGRDRYFRLTGYAGTGKSFLICELMRYLQQHGLSFVVASPTNKASKHLQKLAQQAGLRIECDTIAKLLGQQPELNKDSGKEEFIATYEVDLSEHHVIILDEFSMISKDNFQDILEAAEQTKIIFVGDAAQLPPVGEKEPIVATSPLIKQQATLTEIVRYDGEIGKIAETIRSDRTYSYRVYPFTTTADYSIISLNENDWLHIAGEMFNSSDFRKDPDFCRFLVWRNQTADKLNQWVRERLWGKDAPPYVIGDRLIAKKPVFRVATDISGKKSKKLNWVIVMNNSEECEVIEQPILKNMANWEFWEIPVMSDGGRQLVLRILTPDSEQKRQRTLQEHKDNKKWDQYLSLDKSYDYCPYAYALTTHKAQGSSIEYIFLDARDIKPSSDRQKLQYTALTRARKRAYIPV